MNGLDLLTALDGVDEESLLEAREESKPRRRGFAAVACSLAACLLLAIVIPFAVKMAYAHEHEEGIPHGNPYLEDVIWLSQGEAMGVPEATSGAEKKRLNGLWVSGALYRAAEQSEGRFGILVISLSGEGLVAADEIGLFTDRGIYAEAVGERLFIFPTREELLSLELPKETSERLCFLLISRSEYEQREG